MTTLPVETVPSFIRIPPRLEARAAADAFHLRLQNPELARAIEEADRVVIEGRGSR